MTARHKAILMIPVPFVLLLLALGWISFAITQHSFNERQHIENTLTRIDASLQDQNHAQTYAEGLDLDSLEAFYFLKAPSPTIAKARLQDMLTDLARRAGLAITSAHLAEGEGDTPMAAVQLDMSGDLNALSAFLISIENNTPYLRSHGFSLTRRQGSAEGQFSITIVLQVLSLIEGSEK